MISLQRAFKKEVTVFRQTWKTEAFVDTINLALGTFLFLSPWIFGFTSELARHTSWMAGAAIGIVAILSIADLFESVSIPDFFETEEWINLAIGLWLAVCPWVIGMQDETTAMEIHLVVGVVVATIAAIELWVVHRTPPHAA